MPPVLLPLAACIERHQLSHRWGTSTGLKRLETELNDATPVLFSSNQALGLDTDRLFCRLTHDAAAPDAPPFEVTGPLHGFASALPNAHPDWSACRPRWADCGIEADPWGGCYSLVASTRSELIGACLFRLTLEPSRMPYAAAMDARTAHLTVELDLVQVLRPWRRRGLMSRFCSFMQFVVLDELRELAGTVERFRRSGKVPVRVVLHAKPEALSQAALVARGQLVNALVGAHLALTRWSKERGGPRRVVTFLAP